jgi:hypothetical protein
MVDQIIVERLLADIRANIKELREATDITPVIVMPLQSWQNKGSWQSRICRRFRT